MTDSQTGQPEPAEVTINMDEGPVSDLWAEAMKAEAPVAAVPVAASGAAPVLPAAKAPKTPNTPVEILARMIVLSEEGGRMLETFVNAHPYLIAPNVTKMVEEQLKENAVTMKRLHDQAIARGAVKQG